MYINFLLISKRYFGQIEFSLTDQKESEKAETSSTNNFTVYVPVYVRHSLFDNPALRKACNMHDFDSIPRKSSIFPVNLAKSLFLIRLNVVLQSKMNKSNIKRMAIYAVKKHLSIYTGDIVNSVASIQTWKLDGEEFDLIQITGPKERAKRVIREIDQDK